MASWLELYGSQRACNLIPSLCRLSTTTSTTSASLVVSSSAMANELSTLTAIHFDNLQPIHLALAVVVVFIVALTMVLLVSVFYCCRNCSPCIQRNRRTRRQNTRHQLIEDMVYTRENPRRSTRLTELVEP